MSANNFLLGGIMCLALLTTSCANKDEVYDPNFNQELGITIPEGFTWATTKTVKTVINVNDQYNGKFYYDVSIYSENPTSSTKPLIQGKANVNEPFMEDVTIPASLQKVYITESLRYPNGTVGIIDTKEVSVSELSNVSFTRAASTRGNGNGNGNGKGNGGSESLTYESIKSQYTGWTEITSTDPNYEIQMANGGHYYIDNPNVTFTLKAQNENGNANSEFILYIAKGAHVVINQRNNGNDVSVGTGVEIVNDGCLTIDGVEKTFSVKNEGVFINNGSLKCNIVDFQSKTGEIYLGSAGIINAKTKVDIAGGTITMATGAWINTPSITLGNGQSGVIKLADDAVDVAGSQYAALITTSSITTQGSATISIEGNDKAKLLVECPTEPIALGCNAEYSKNAIEQITTPTCACLDGYGITTTTSSDVIYALEDQYPNAGDFDVNDVVVSLNGSLVKTNTASSTTYSVKVSGKLLAVGGTLSSAGYVELIDGSGNVVASAKLLFDDAHQKMGGSGFINTEAGKTKVTAADLSAIFDNVNLTSFDTATNLRFFIKANGGTPIYVADQGGSKAGSQIIGGIRIFGYDFKYPLEQVNITQAYPNIKNWISSNLKENTDWYKYPTSGKVYE